MALSDITRDGVLRAMAEYDDLGADEFHATGQQTVVKTLEALGFSFAPVSTEDARAWLVTTKSDYRPFGGYTKYDDDPLVTTATTAMPPTHGKGGSVTGWCSGMKSA